jgi:hypothetical protein
MGEQRRNENEREPAPAPWEELLCRAIEMEIGKGLRERMELLQELPDNLLTLLKQITGEGESE